MDLWNDGRSGPAGCLAGNLVLAEIARTTSEQFFPRKGTTFVGGRAIWVGRICSTDSYLGGRDKHWANISVEQHREIAEEARNAGYSLNYLFITAQQNQPVIHYWIIPGELIERVGFRGQREGSFVFALHIREDEKLAPGRFMLEGEDVTDFHRVLKLNATDRERLDVLFEQAKRGRGEASRRGAKVSIPTAEQFQIPLGAGRSAVLSIPLPAARVDLNRIKGWIDLMEDVLTEKMVSEADARERASRSLAQMQRRAVDSGASEMSDAEVDAEIASTRRERR